MYDAREISNYLLDIAEEQNKKLTNMSILKIIYFAHGWYLAAFGKPLVKNRFEAWQYGPVIRVVYDQFSKFRNNYITSRALILNLDKECYDIAKPNLTPNDASFIRDVFKYYADMNAFALSDITHAPGSPWDKVWNNNNGKVRVGMVISNDEIREYFLSISKSSQQN
ncbi:MAG TPA: type II toxin-antitoxin system antitoxin SocA domain-containing protein [Azospirillum sp.]